MNKIINKFKQWYTEGLLGELFVNKEIIKVKIKKDLERLNRR